KINSLEARIQILSDEQLAFKTNEFKEQIERGRTLNDILPEAFAVVRETARRKLNQRHYDVQLIGGMVLHNGTIAEMKTGEGKTLTATLALYLNALSGKGAHLVTVNDYLARRDAEWMSPVYNHLGMSVGIIQNSIPDSERKKIYQSDIVYATNNELGFDYLRDNMKFRLEDYVQRELNYAIVDEVDSILIDEARTPLIISGSSDESSRLYSDANRAMHSLVKDVDYEVDEKARSTQLTESGNDKVESFFGVKNLYALDHIKLVHHVNQALRAHALFKSDVDYVVKDDQVLIVDEFTGRILPGRRYSDGLHQALEAKEGVKIERESQTLASITLQNYFRLYGKLAGMTGTAVTEAEEFHKIYKLDVIAIPTNKDMIRKDKQDLIFLSKNAKYKAIVEDIKERHSKGQPALIGTIAIETSELLSMILTANGIPHEVLNAKNHAREAEIVAHAGEKGRVTIATNMAGRGTDIKLTDESRAAGGLYILGTERHESRRIDNQLRGRAGRQGDPGESRFYISLEDDLIRIFSPGDTIKKRMQMLGMTEDENIESTFISKRIEDSQEKVEKHNFDIRKHLLEYDDVLNQQRTIVYRIRREVLEGDARITELVRLMISDAVSDLMHTLVPSKGAKAEEIAEFTKSLAQMVNTTPEQLEALPFYKAKNLIHLQDDLVEYLLQRYEAPGGETVDQHKLAMLQDAHKWLMLETIDQAWKQHMLNLDHLKEGISLRSWGQKNPLIEYKREAFGMFEDMLRQVRAEVVHHVFHLNVDHFNHAELERKREQELEHLHLTGPEEPEGDHHHDHEHEQAQSDKTGRNEDCPCGSGKKYKKCCAK
nr:preprotein translocase subunit SecA [Candidatus Dependentiae bacterium]